MKKKMLWQSYDARIVAQLRQEHFSPTLTNYAQSVRLKRFEKTGFLLRVTDRYLFASIP